MYVHRRGLVVILAGLIFWSCGSIKQYSTPQQPLRDTLKTYVGGAILEIEKEESLPNAFGGADIYGGRRPTGSISLKYLGLGEEGKIKLRVLATDIETNEDWRRRLGREGYATSSTDAIDFEHDWQDPFAMEGFTIEFLDAESSSLTYRVQRTGAPSG